MSLMSINTQRFGAGPTESRLYSQVACLRDETDYLGSLLIAEASDNEWRSDKTPEEYTGLVDVATKLQIMQSEHKQLNSKH